MELGDSPGRARAPKTRAEPPQGNHPRRILIAGVRGLANYGGFESYVSGLAPRLASLGYLVSCSSETRPNAPVSAGVKLEPFPLRPPSNPRLRLLYEPLYDAYFILKGRYDTIYGVGCLGGVLYGVPRLLGKKSIVNVAGLEWKRGRYGPFTALAIRLLWVACTLSATRVALDNKQLVAHLNPRQRPKSLYAPYGIEDTKLNYSKWSETPASQVAEEGSFWLQMARIEPDNNVLASVEALSVSKTKKKLLVIGSFTSQSYKDMVLRAVSGNRLGDRVTFLKPVYGRPDVLNEMRRSSFAYIHGHSVGGTNPSLLEIMQIGKATLAFDVPFNREVGGETMYYYRSPQELAELMDHSEWNRDEASAMGMKARERVFSRHSWSGIMPQYSAFFD